MPPRNRPTTVGGLALLLAVLVSASSADAQAQEHRDAAPTAPADAPPASDAPEDRAPDTEPAILCFHWGDEGYIAAGPDVMVGACPGGTDTLSGGDDPPGPGVDVPGDEDTIYGRGPSDVLTSSCPGATDTLLPPADPPAPVSEDPPPE